MNLQNSTIKPRRKTKQTQERKILQAEGAIIAVGEAEAYGKTCRFFRQVSEKELEGLNLLLAQAEYKNIDQVNEDEEICLTLDWRGKPRIFAFYPVIVSKAA